MYKQTRLLSYTKPRLFRGPATSTELKFKDTTLNVTTMAINNVTFSPISASLLLNGLVPDSTASGRIGRKVNIKSIYVRGTFQMAASSTGSGQCRMLLFWDKQANGALCSVTDVLATDAFTAVNNISNTDRFMTISDQIINPITVATAGPSQVAFQIYKKVNLSTQFNAGTAGTIADISSGALYVMFAQSGAVAVAAPTVVGTVRIRYSDL